MRGFPKTIGSKEDMENLLAMPEHAGQAKAKLAKLEAGSTVWVPVNKLTKTQAGLTSPTQQVSVQVAAEGKEERYQMELREDPQSSFARLGLAGLKESEPVLADAEPIDLKLEPEGIKEGVEYVNKK